jgi:hypothetical protein
LDLFQAEEMAPVEQTERRIRRDEPEGRAGLQQKADMTVVHDHRQGS